MFFATIREARSRLALDVGFDPFISGGWGRCTIARLAAEGYYVDRKRAEEMRRGHNCRVCQAPLKREWDGRQEYWPTECSEHRKYRFECDNGHVWYATDEEDRKNGHKCSKCGEYWQ